jgi:hypothetical protein
MCQVQNDVADIGVGCVSMALDRYSMQQTWLSFFHCIKKIVFLNCKKPCFGKMINYLFSILAKIVSAIQRPTWQHWLEHIC